MSVTDSDQAPAPILSDNPRGGLVRELVNGDYGLPTTYWVFGVCGNGLFSSLLKRVTSKEWLVALTIANAVYAVTVAVGVWRAADKYEGRREWGVLARVAVVLGVAALTFKWIHVLSME